MNTNTGALIDALFESALETPRWERFLELLRVATSSDYVAMTLWPANWHYDDAVHVVTGGITEQECREIYHNCLYPINPSRGEEFREGKTYTFEQLSEIDDFTYNQAYAEFLSNSNANYFRHIRVKDLHHLECWVTIVQSASDFREEDDELLRALTPVLKGVIGAYVSSAGDRLEAAIGRNCRARQHVGWLALDRHATVVHFDDRGRAMLERAGTIGLDAAGRLALPWPKLEREVLQAIDEMAAGRTDRPRSFFLSRNPRLELVLSPMDYEDLAASGKAVVMAYLHEESWDDAELSTHLASTFGLSPTEAKMAQELCCGLTFPEMAVRRGVKVDTIRTYSKALFQKTGARGQADLLHILMGSILGFVPLI